MPQDIVTINLGGINCYLVKSTVGCILIDTGISTKRFKLEKELERVGCKTEDVNLIVLTHGDHDHAGNCQYLNKKYGIKIAMHNGDSGMVERGDMNWNRKANPDKISILFKMISFLFSRSIKFDTFKPDMYIEDGYDFSVHGVDAKVVHIPGHSMGSIGILTTDGDFICGDLLINIGKPSLHFAISDINEANSSVEKLKPLEIKTVYPGHGKPFQMELFIKKYRCPCDSIKM
jgi:hydroxyacylglutathione hydrolase